MDVSNRTAALEQLQPLVGEWTTEAAFSFTPEPVGGRVTFAWELGGQFLLERTSVNHPEAPDSVAMISADDDGYLQHYFDSRGVVRTYRMTLRDDVWTLLRDRPDFTPLDFAQRYTGRLGADGQTVTGRWEMSHDRGTTWAHDFDLNYRRTR